MPLEELLKLYNYGGPMAADNSEGDAVDSGKKVGHQQERLRDVRPEKNRHEKNGLASGTVKSKSTEVGSSKSLRFIVLWHESFDFS